MRKRLGWFLCILLALAVLPFALSGVGVDSPETAVALSGGEYVYVGGQPIGIAVSAGGLIVLDVGEVSSPNGVVTPLADAGLQRGDVVTKLNGESLTSMFQLKDAVDKSDGELILTVRGKNGIEREARVTPALDKLSGAKRLGLFAKEDVGGIGTLTFVTESGRFAALGHRILDSESGLSFELDDGDIYPADVTGVQKGENGKAGGLCASLNRIQKPLGDVDKNTEIGIYGDYADKPEGERIRIAAKGEAKMGHAQILTTVYGTNPKLYDIEVVKIISQENSSERGLVLSVRDKELLALTGGIVQGMSGSPIIQNGALIGAVTHVFLSDPTRGYGVHSRFMFEAAEENSALKEAA